MILPKTGTILAPASMHLALYDQIGNQLGLQVLSVETFIDMFKKEVEVSEIQMMYQIKDCLQKLSPVNPFYDSKDDPTFLKEVYTFLKRKSLYQINDFPEETSKEEALYEIIQCCQSIHFPTIKLPKLEDVYILRREYTDLFWINQLLDAGAKWLEEDRQPETHYVTMATIRKQAQWVCEEIIDQNYCANDVFIALDSKDQAVMEQMLHTYKIPYTLSKSQAHSTIPAQWLACLDYAKEQSIENLCQLISLCFPKEKGLLDWYRLGLSDDGIYKENEFVDEYTYAHYQKLSEKAQQFEETYDLNFAYNDFEKMAAFIQSLHKPTQDNLSIFATIQDLIIEAYPNIKESSDLDILYSEIQNLNPSQTADSLEGVWIGSRQEISSLRKIVFFLGVHGKTYPSYRQESGIFNEAYIGKTAWPSLASRLDQQKEMLNKSLNQPEILYVSYPQTDYQSKSFEPSVEMNEWLGKAKFVDIEEASTYEKPSFTLSKDMAEHLFVRDQKVCGSVSSFETFAHCPLRYFLQYGLYLQEQKDWTDIRVRGSLLHKILELAIQQYGKEYCENDLQAIIDEQFDWVEEHFPDKKAWVNNQKAEVQWKLKQLMYRLLLFEKNWKMQPKDTEHEFYYEGDNFKMHGFIDRIDASKHAFVVLDYKSSTKTLETKDFLKGTALQLITYAIELEEENHMVPIGVFYISLSSPLGEEVGVKLNYQRKSKNYDDKSFIIGLKEYKDKGKLNGWVFDKQDLGLYDDSNYFRTKSKIPSFVYVKACWKQIIESIISDIRLGMIAPDTDDSTCSYCPYSMICRNAKQTVEKPNRVEGAEE